MIMGHIFEPSFSAWIFLGDIQTSLNVNLNVKSLNDLLLTHSFQYHINLIYFSQSHDCFLTLSHILKYLSVSLHWTRHHIWSVLNIETSTSRVFKSSTSQKCRTLKPLLLSNLFFPLNSIINGELYFPISFKTLHLSGTWNALELDQYCITFSHVSELLKSQSYIFHCSEKSISFNWWRLVNRRNDKKIPRIYSYLHNCFLDCVMPCGLGQDTMSIWKLTYCEIKLSRNLWGDGPEHRQA